MTFFRFLLFLFAAALALLGWMYWTAIADPVVRETEVGLDDWPRGAASIRAVLISDIHVAGPDMPPERLARIVGLVNAIHPDVVLIAGDFVGDKDFGTRIYSATDIAETLARLRPRLGVFAVLGNHDHWRSAGQVREALIRAGVQVLDNQAIEAGPLAIGGLDDPFIHEDDLPSTITALRRLRGAKLLLSHSPDPFPRMPSDIGLMVAGHTHCGQIRLPLYGAISTESAYGDRYACGRVDENGKTLVVTAGLGTSVLPLRLGAVPDLWLITIGPPRGTIRSVVAR